MLKFFLFFCLISVNLWAFDAKVITSRVAQLDKNFIFIKDEPNIVIGASAIVVKQIKNATSIISRASVVAKDGKFAKLELKPFTMLAQKALPELDVKVETGDEVLVNFLYDRALLIAPDEASYKQVVGDLSEIYFIHPDILGAYMVREFKVSPKKEDFQLFCANNALGIVGFVLKNKVQFIDCQDFTPLFEKPLATTSTTPQTPFYSNITSYRKNVFNVKQSRIKDYYGYYEGLLGAKK